MPEGLEAEIWCRSAQRLVGRTITSVWCDQRVAPAGLGDLLTGAEIRAVRRRGKVVLVDTALADTALADTALADTALADTALADTAPVLGLHFGMTGRLVVDGWAPIERLEYASGADRAEWDRLRLETEPSVDRGPALRMNDPRRLGRISLDPDLSHLGPDLLSVTAAQLGERLARRRIAVKTALLDQRVVAGLGNLCADEVLFWAGVAPARPADALVARDLDAISQACRERLGAMLAAGGSTHGELSPDVRTAEGVCPLDGGQLRRTSINGRTAVWCETHQR